MKAYGHSRKDKLECRYGCCTGKSGKDRSSRVSVDRSNRKSARQEQKKECSFGYQSANCVDG